MKESDNEQNAKSLILERDGFGPLGPQHKGKKNIRDFFNFNKDDNAIFKNDVHNGAYELFEIDQDMVMGLKDRIYNRTRDKPPKPTDLDDENTKRKKKKGKGDGGDDDDDDLNNNNYKGYNDFDPDHKVLTREELKNKIQKQELYGMLQTKNDLNKE